MSLPNFQYLSPSTIDELKSMLAEYREKAKILSGGTDLLVLMKDKLCSPESLIDISRIKSLSGIDYDQTTGLSIGAATKMKEIESSPVIKEKYTALHKAVGLVGSPQVRAMATIGGNSCNASPAADTPPALVVLGAKVCLASKRGERELALEDFIKGNRHTDLQPDEYLEKFIIPDISPNSASFFDLIALRAAVEIDIASLAVNLTIDKQGKVGNIRIAMGSVAPIPLRAIAAENMLIGQMLSKELIEKAAAKCADEAKPIDDIRASAGYRRHLIKVLAGRTIQKTLATIR